jgi:hypothetical protein
METNIGILLSLVEGVCEKKSFSKKCGQPYVYSRASFIVFFVIMFLKKIHHFKAMYKFAQRHYQRFGWSKCPTRRTIKTRFEALPNLLPIVIPNIALNICSVNRCFEFKWAFIDKSVFRSLGGIWHTKHMKEGFVPHPSIDTDASWGKSDYHGWRFGYGLHLIVNEFRFPVAATVSTASDKDYNFVKKLLIYLHHKIGIVVGDRGYFCAEIIEQIKNEYDILLQTIKVFEQSCKNNIKDWYNNLVSTPQARWLYRLRKPSIEPTFAIIKELFNLKEESQLPFRGVKRVSAYLLTCTITLQLMMIDNYNNNRNMGDTSTFRTIF